MDAKHPFFFALWFTAGDILIGGAFPKQHIRKYTHTRKNHIAAHRHNQQTQFGSHEYMEMRMTESMCCSIFVHVSLILFVLP